jgi:hypothetical protein
VAKPTTSLKFTVYGGIDEEEEKPQEAQSSYSSGPSDQAGPGSLAGYVDLEDYVETDDDLNVDAYANKVSGGVMSGFQLSALCGDD